MPPWCPPSILFDDRRVPATRCHPHDTLHTRRLDLALALLSDARAPTGDITMVVTYDVGRLYMLEGLCQLWGGPIAAAVYVVSDALQQRDLPAKILPVW